MRRIRLVFAVAMMVVASNRLPHHGAPRQRRLVGRLPVGLVVGLVRRLRCRRLEALAPPMVTRQLT